MAKETNKAELIIVHSSLENGMFDMDTGPRARGDVMHIVDSLLETAKDPKGNAKGGFKLVSAGLCPTFDESVEGISNLPLQQEYNNDPLLFKISAQVATGINPATPLNISKSFLDYKKTMKEGQEAIKNKRFSTFFAKMHEVMPFMAKAKTIFERLRDTKDVLLGRSKAVSIESLSGRGGTQIPFERGGEGKIQQNVQQGTNEFLQRAAAHQAAQQNQRTSA